MDSAHATFPPRRLLGTGVPHAGSDAAAKKRRTRVSTTARATASTKRTSRMIPATAVVRTVCTYMTSVSFGSPYSMYVYDLGVMW